MEFIVLRHRILGMILLIIDIIVMILLISCIWPEIIGIVYLTSMALIDSLKCPELTF